MGNKFVYLPSYVLKFASGKALNKDKDLSEIISPENFDFLSTTYESASSRSKTLKTHAYITYLSTRAALRSSDFYYIK